MNKNDLPMERFLVSLPKKHAKDLKKEANETGDSVSSIIRRAVLHYYARMEKK